MNNEQVMGLLRQLLPVLGTVATMLGVSASTWSNWSNLILTAAGPLMILGSLAWSMISKTETNIVKSASAQPNVTSMTVKTPDLVAAVKAADPATEAKLTS